MTSSVNTSNEELFLFLHLPTERERIDANSS